MTNNRNHLLSRRFLAILAFLSIAFVNLPISTTVLGETREEKAAKLAEKIKANITKLGTGKDAKVEVKLKDGTKLKGYVDKINENSFVVVDDKTGVSTEVLYPNVKQVKGNNPSTGAKIAIGVGIVVLVIAIAAIAGRDQ